MIASMTGFGRAAVKENGINVLIEIRSLNHRFLDMDIRVPKDLQIYEQEIRDLISSQLSRGRVSTTITIKGDELPVSAPTIDKSLATNYINMLNELKEDLNLEGAVKLDQLLSLPDIITYDYSTAVDSNIWDPVKKALNLALTDLKEMRIREGMEIKKDLQARINAISAIIKNVEQHAKNNSQEMFEKLRDRIRIIVQEQKLDDSRLEMEVALLAEKVDVTEECIRFKSHNTLFLELLENGTSEGRKLNFLLQEMHREANTIGAKANNAQIAHWVVEFKEEVEKLREQIQNIE